MRAPRRVRIALLLASLLLLNSACDSVTGPVAESTTSSCERISFAGGWYLTGAWSPDGKKVASLTAFDAYGRYSRGLHIVDVKTGHEERVASFDEIGFPLRVVWNPQPGSTRLLLDYGLGQAVFDYVSREWTQLDGEGYSTRDAGWTPEGDSIVFTRLVPLSSPPELNGLHIGEWRGGGRRRVLLPDGGLVVPGSPVAFSPDGRWMAYRENVRDDNAMAIPRYEVAIIGRDGRGHRQLTRLRGDVDNIQWIRDGRALLFTHRSGACLEVGGNTPIRTMCIDLETGRVSPWREELTDQRFQFGWDFTLDPEGERALVVRQDHTFRRVIQGVHYRLGALHVMSIHGGKATKLVRSSGPPPVDDTSGAGSPYDSMDAPFTPPAAVPR